MKKSASGGSESRILEASYTGPLPLPGHLEHYNTIDATFANRIMAMAETAQSVSNSLRRTEVEATAFATKADAWGNLIGVTGRMFADLLTLGATILFVYWDKNVPALLAGIVAILLLLNTVRTVRGAGPDG